MAQKTIVTMVDDVTGEEIKDGSGQTIQVGWLGKTYELDVSGATMAGLEEYFNDVLHSARPVRERRAASSSNGSSDSKKAHAERVARIREWARGQGMEIAERGRINRDILEAYQEANPQDVAA